MRFLHPLAVLASVISSCAVHVPEGRVVCDDDDDCPSSMTCRLDVRRCYSDGPPVLDSGMTDTGTSDAGVPGCANGSRQAPARPGLVDDPADSIAPVVFALKDILLDTRDQGPNGAPLWQSVGLNLDGRCTTIANELWTCRPTGAAPHFASDGSDQSGLEALNVGVDNVFGKSLFGLLDIRYTSTVDLTDPNLYADTLQGYAARLQEEGLSVIILRIHGWNGRDDDPLVRVDIAQSVRGGPGTATTPPNVMPTDPAFQQLVPEWTGNDWFWLRADSFVTNDTSIPKVFDANAYIANRQLVVRLPDRAELLFVGPTIGLRVALTDGRVVGRISADNRRIEDLDVGGRWSKNDLLQTAKAIEICPGTQIYNVIYGTIDNISDVPSDRTRDGTLAADTLLTPCDAVSIGMRFQGYAAHIVESPLVDVPPLPDPCP